MNDTNNMGTPSVAALGSAFPTGAGSHAGQSCNQCGATVLSSGGGYDTIPGQSNERLSTTTNRGSLWPSKLFYFLWFGIVGAANLFFLKLQISGGVSPGEAALLNLLVAVGSRNEQLISALHRAAVWSPLQGRMTKYAVNRMVHQFGGAHASAALCTIAWLSAACAISFKADGVTVEGVLAVATLTVLAVMATTATPAIRHKRHELFEKVHRYGGWLALGLAFAQATVANFVAANFVPGATVLDVLTTLARDPSFELLAVIAVLVLIPWLTLQTTWDVDAEVFAGKVVKLTFPGRGGLGTFARISFGRIEWHSFSVAFHDPAAYRGRGNISLLVASAGDWTHRLAKRVASGNVPERIWVRRVRPPGFMYSIKAYRRSLVIATGAGIAPVLPYITSGRAQIFVIWIVQDPEGTFGEVASVARRHPATYTWDTGRYGRPDLAQLAIDAARALGADSVFCVSNREGTETVVNACLAEGVPAFGATWDS